MSLEASESAQYAVSELVYRDILLLWAHIMDFENERRAVNRNLVEAIVFDCSLFIVTSCVLNIVLRLLLNTLVGVIASVELRGTTEYVLMKFAVLSLLIIYSNTGS